MKVLTFSLNDEPLPGEVESAALAAPTRLSAPTARARIQNCETIRILVFMVLFG
jgi:hypothetical protein